MGARKSELLGICLIKRTTNQLEVTIHLYRHSTHKIKISFMKANKFWGKNSEHCISIFFFVVVTVYII